MRDVGTDIIQEGKVYLMLDEVQYARDWLPVVKKYYDLYPDVKFYLTGSSSLLISDRALASLAGRFFFVDVYPMSFREFAEARGEVRSGENRAAGSSRCSTTI
ncbi:MAG: AAA family ATPase [Thaumarchaeota archaeon]|nr:AAA family ATPase [Nitrososphaerota archaeon]